MIKKDEYVWLVFDRCSCEYENCYGMENVAVYTNEKTAKYAADLRSIHYGGYTGHPDMHKRKVKVSTKAASY